MLYYDLCFFFNNVLIVTSFTLFQMSKEEFDAEFAADILDDFDAL